ncbi:MAG: tyrosine-type recombinase/integrase [Patescibacteria group bacterium]
MNIEIAIVYFINDGILAGKSPATLEGYKYSLQYLHQFIKLQFLPQELSSITREVLSQYFIEGVKVKSWSKQNHWTQYKNLSVFFNWSVKKQLITTNPLSDIPKPKLPPRIPKALSEQEAIELLRVVSNMPGKYRFTKLRNKAIISCLLFTGLRKSELLNLKTTDVDLHNGFIFVEKGKGGKRREIPIEETTLKIILQDYADYKNKLGKISIWFFNGTFGTKGKNAGKLSESGFALLFRSIRFVYKKGIHAHKLRHTFATLMLDKDCDLFTLQQLMGHSQISTTTIYLNSTRKKKIEAIKKMTISLNE